MSSTRVRTLKLRKHGMFSNVNEVVQQLHLAEQGRYEFVIDWRKSCYLDPERSGDPWTYYFEPCFPQASPQAGSSDMLEGGPAVACTRDNIITPRVADGQCDPLLLPLDRELAGHYIEKYIRLHAGILDMLQDVIDDWPNRQIVGLHIRGPRRTHRGLNRLRGQIVSDDVVPLEWYFRAVDDVLASMPDASIFACSDSSAVIDSVGARFPGRVLTFGATRSAFGEMHRNHPRNEGLTFDPYKLGLDVVLEAHLLARTSHFVHGNSNVVNFVLCRNPGLKNTYVYAGLTPDA